MDNTGLAELPQTTKKRRPRINYALAATLVTQGVTLEEAAKESGAKNANVLRVGLIRHGVTATVARSLQPTPERIQTITAKIASQASELLRNSLAGTLNKHATALEQVEAKPDLKHITQVGQALEPLARTAKIVHDWGNETKLGLVALGVVEQLDQAQDAIDITPCGVEATIQSVPESAPESSTPQG